MTVIRIVTATHFDQPGTKVFAHKTAGGARRRAFELVSQMLIDSKLEFQASDVTWTRGLEHLNNSGRECDVSIATVEIEP